jgi:nucleotide-binding universal stress UspA family protein
MRRLDMPPRGNRIPRARDREKRTMFKTIVVGTDGSERAGVAVAHAVQLAALSQGELHIVAAVDPTSTPAVTASAFGVAAAPVDAGDMDSLYREAVDGAAGWARDQGVNARTHIFTGSPADVLCEVARQVGADLVVVGNRGMQGVLKVFGSVPNSVSHGAPCSVLIVDTRGA